MCIHWSCLHKALVLIPEFCKYDLNLGGAGKAQMVWFRSSVGVNLVLRHSRKRNVHLCILQRCDYLPFYSIYSII